MQCRVWLGGRAAGPGLLAELSELTLGEEVNLDLVQNDSGIVDRSGKFEAPQFLAVCNMLIVSPLRVKSWMETCNRLCDLVTALASCLLFGHAVLLICKINSTRSYLNRTLAAFMLDQ